MIVKKGTRVKFCGCVNIAGSDEEFDSFVLEEDTDSDTLDKEAFEVAMDYFQVEGWHKVVGEEEE